MQKFREFLKEVTTLRTVWIDKGQGKWVVKKRMHPFLRGVIAVVVLTMGTTAYFSFSSKSNVKKAEAEPEVKISRLIDYEPDKLKASLPTINVPETSNAPAVNVNMKQQTLNIPIYNNDDNDIAKKNNGIIISEPEKLFAPDVNNDKYRILVSKSRYTLSLFRGNDLVKEYPIAVGSNPGDKQRVGDHRTPVGNFKIVSIENASGWKHDFGDGKGKIAGAYGPWFLRLDAKGWKGIGIHGTHDPDSRGTMATEGCIRLSNEDIAELRQYAYRNMPATIREN